MAAFTTHKWQGNLILRVLVLSKKKIVSPIFPLSNLHNFHWHTDIPVRLDTHWIHQFGPCENAEHLGIGKALNLSADVST